MPISTIDNCSEAHWLDVRSILTEVIEAAGFEPRLVSDADDIGIIQKRIIQNIYENPVVVCDVSGKNPNVMFELGMRLAFDKPTIIVKDDKTSYSFDTAPIEHVQYPRDLRFGQIIEFKQTLIDKLAGTYKKSREDTSYTPFLKHFGAFTVAKLATKSISSDEFIIEELRNLRRLITRREIAPGIPRSEVGKRTLCLMDLRVKTSTVARTIAPLIRGGISIDEQERGHVHVQFLGRETVPTTRILDACRTLAGIARMLDDDS